MSADPSTDPECEPPDDPPADGPWEWTCPDCGTVWRKRGHFWWDPVDLWWETDVDPLRLPHWRRADR